MVPYRSSRWHFPFLEPAEKWPQTGLPLVRDVALKTGELSSWLTQEKAFKLPTQLAHTTLIGSLRLLYQIWDPSDDLANSDRMPMSKSSLDLLITTLNLPRCFPFDFASRKPVPIRLKMINGPNSSNLGTLSTHIVSLTTDRPPRYRLPKSIDIGFIHDYGTVIQS